MKTAAVSELKARLSKYLNRVKAGEEVLITDRGNPVARLLPISRARAVRETMTSMEKRGLIKLGSGKLPKGFWTMPKAEDSEGLRQAREALTTLAEGWSEIQPPELVRHRAEGLLMIHSLRAADALQLAAALLWAEEATLGAEFVCLDQYLRDAAFKEGFTVLPSI